MIPLFSGYAIQFCGWLLEFLVISKFVLFLLLYCQWEPSETETSPDGKQVKIPTRKIQELGVKYLVFRNKQCWPQIYSFFIMKTPRCLSVSLMSREMGGGTAFLSFSRVYSAFVWNCFVVVVFFLFEKVKFWNLFGHPRNPPPPPIWIVNKNTGKKPKKRYF